MCDHSGKLVACMDGELPEREAADVKRHLQECAECRECVAAFEEASGAFDAYCEATVAAADESSIAETRARLAGMEPRAEGAARRGLLSRLKPRPTNPAVERFDAHCDATLRVAEEGGSHLIDNFEEQGFSRAERSCRAASSVRGEVSASLTRAEDRREVPRRAEHSRVPSPGNFLCARDGRGSLRDDNAKRKRLGVAMSVAGITAAAAIAVLLVLPRQIPGQIARQVAGQTPVRVPSGAETLHAVQRSVGPEEPEEPEEFDARRAPEMTAPPAVAARKLLRRGALATGGIRHSVGEAGHQAGNQVPRFGQAENASALAPEPPIEIAIPGDTMFPPGAVPDGISFTAVVMMSADDAAQVAAMRSQGLLPSPYRGPLPGPYRGLLPSPHVSGFSNGGNRP